MPTPQHVHTVAEVVSITPVPGCPGYLDVLRRCRCGAESINLRAPDRIEWSGAWGEPAGAAPPAD